MAPNSPDALRQDLVIWRGGEGSDANYGGKRLDTHCAVALTW